MPRESLAPKSPSSSTTARPERDPRSSRERSRLGRLGGRGATLAIQRLALQRFDAVVSDQAHHDVARPLQDLGLGQDDPVAHLKHANARRDVSQELGHGGIDGYAHGPSIIFFNRLNPKKSDIW